MRRASPKRRRPRGGPWRGRKRPHRQSQFDRRRFDRQLAIAAHPIASTADGLDQLGVKASIDFCAQPADVAFDEVRARVEMERPDILQQHGARYDLARVTHEIFEEFVLLLLEFDPGSRPSAPPLEQIEFEVARPPAS